MAAPDPKRGGKLPRQYEKPAFRGVFADVGPHRAERFERRGGADDARVLSYLSAHGFEGRCDEGVDRSAYDIVFETRRRIPYAKREGARKNNEVLMLSVQTLHR
jgi:hypothetical protein